jgi:hypothetical protein
LAEFAKRGINPTEVGFCDSPAFLASEHKNPRFLEMYARYVALRDYDAEYIERVLLIVPVVAEILRVQLVENGRLGACVDMSGILSKTLDKLGIWNYCVNGSLTIEYPEHSGIPPHYYWTVDHGNFTAAHAWVAAPPFEVVDVTVCQQPCATAERELLPFCVIASSLARGEVDVEDIVSVAVRLELTRKSVPYRNILAKVRPGLVEFLKYFPVGVHITSKGTQLKYIPVAIFAPNAPLEGLSMMDFAGKSPYGVYQELILPVLRDIADT